MESNHRHVDFQSTALPTELPRHKALRLKVVVYHTYFVFGVHLFSPRRVYVVTSLSWRQGIAHLSNHLLLGRIPAMSVNLSVLGILPSKNLGRERAPLTRCAYGALIFSHPPRNILPQGRYNYTGGMSNPCRGLTFSSWAHPSGQQGMRLLI